MKRVAVFAPMGTLDHQTGILNAIRCFAAAGYDVDVLTVRNLRFAEVRFESDQIRVHHMPLRFDADREPRALVTLLFTGWVLSRWRRHPLVFAGGIRGLIAAYAYALLRRCEIVNYQTELYVGDKLDTRARRLFKAIERRAAQRSRITIEHDETRRQLLVADLGVPAERVVIVPNAPCGPAAQRGSDLLPRRLGLPAGIRLLLCPGTLSDFFATPVAVQAAQFLPPDWLCVIHSAQPRSPDEPYLERLRRLDVGGRVRFSLEPLPYGQIDDVMASAGVGLVLYSLDVGDNTAAVGLASGKLTHFLKVGVPVIVSPLPSLAAFVRQHGVGEVLDDPAALPMLLERIQRDLDGYRRRALRCFDEELAYERHFAAVLAVTDRLAEADAS